jgi:hypothetical protein
MGGDPPNPPAQPGGGCRARARRGRNKVAHRWKAPRVRLISLLFAEHRVKRPSAQEGRAAQVAKASSRAERCWPIRASGSFQRAVSVRRLLTLNPVERREGGREAAGGPRKWDVRGSASPRFFAMARARAAASFESAAVDVASAPRRYRRATSDLQPMPRRCRDERCPNGSGWGEALVSGLYLGLRWGSTPIPPR